jgi:ATP-dependent Lon protease
MSETTARPTTLLPVLSVPSVVLPGTVVTLSLSNPAARAAVEAAGRGDGRVLLLAQPLGDEAAQLGVVARVPNTATLPGGEQAAILQAEQRAQVVALHTSDRGADHADVELVVEPRVSPRVEAEVRELRVVLEEIARLRQSRRLPEILRSVAEPGALADAVTTWAEAPDARRLEVLHAVALDVRIALVSEWAKQHLAELQVTAQIRADVTEGASTSSSASTCCASSWPPSARSWARATTMWSACTARSSTNCATTCRRRRPTSSPRRSTGWSG